MARDDFPESVKRELAARVGHKCSNPGCRAASAGPQITPTGAVNLGVAAHITAASPGGPRYSAEASSVDRASSANGLWLCQNCAKRIDSDPSRFTVEILNDWKLQAEAAANLELGRPATGATSNVAPSCEATLSLGYKVLRRHCDPTTAYCFQHDYDAVVTITNSSNRILRNWTLELEFPRVLRMPDVSYGSTEVTDHTTPRMLFRRVGRDPIYPRQQQALKIGYRMNDETFDMGEALRSQLFVARGYVDDLLVSEVEKRVEEMEQF